MSAAICIVFRDRKRINNSLYFYLFINFVLSVRCWPKKEAEERRRRDHVRWLDGGEWLSTRFIVAVKSNLMRCYCCAVQIERLRGAATEQREVQIICRKFLAKIETKESSLWLQKVIQNNPLRRNRQLSYDGPYVGVSVWVATSRSKKKTLRPDWNLVLLFSWIKYFPMNSHSVRLFFGSHLPMHSFEVVASTICVGGWWWPIHLSQTAKIKFSSINKLSLLVGIEPPINLFWKMHNIQCEISTVFLPSFCHSSHLTVFVLRNWARSQQNAN